MRDCAKSGLVLAILAIAGTAFAGRQDGTDKKTEIRVERKDIPSAVEYLFSRLVRPGRLVKVEAGKPGHVIRTYRVTLSHGRLLSKELVKVERIEPTPTKFLMARSGMALDRHMFARSRVLDMVATAYPPNPNHPWSRVRSHTATGRPAQFGLVAVDPRVIPLGTKVYVEGYGFAIAADTGGAIKGNRIDLCMETDRLCRMYGRRRVKVHVLRQR
jgi:3D (Asp-Asp-Asp) domain-containing protein